jgi:2',3'-cyclic-nucleotide 2'-phosphodiesterase (5'-nucleotidase family)
MFADEKLVGAAIQKLVDKIKDEEAKKMGQLTLSLVSDDDDDKVTQIGSHAKKARDAHKEIADKVDGAFKGKK